MKTNNETVFISYDQALELVDRIEKRCWNQFDYGTSELEKEAMAQLLSDTGVKVSDLIDVSNLADNYAINAEIVRGDKEAESYSKSSLDDALFTWIENGEKYYCLSW